MRKAPKSRLNQNSNVVNKIARLYAPIVQTSAFNRTLYCTRIFIFRLCLAQPAKLDMERDFKKKRISQHPGLGKPAPVSIVSDIGHEKLQVALLQSQMETTTWRAAPHQRQLWRAVINEFLF